MSQDFAEIRLVGFDCALDLTGTLTTMNRVLARRDPKLAPPEDLQTGRSSKPSPQRDLLIEAVRRNLDYIRGRNDPRTGRHGRKHASSSDRRQYRDLGLIERYLG